MIKKIIFFLLLALLLIQLFRPTRNLGASPTPDNIEFAYTTPQEVKNILKISCNDCHSNHTRYPWYAEVQPVAWWLNSHIVGAKNQLNFDKFKTYSPRRQYDKVKQTIKLVKEEEMPLPSYTWIHKDAILTLGQKHQITSWADAIRLHLERTYPMDSLIRKKP